MNKKAVAFIEENMKTIFAYVLSRCSCKEDAEDLAGEIILAILNSSDKIRNEDAFFGYVWAIAANTYKNFLCFFGEQYWYIWKENLIIIDKEKQININKIKLCKIWGCFL